MRMGAALPKQFLSVAGKPIFLHSIDAFLNAYEEMQIVLVMSSAFSSMAKSMLEEYHYRSSIEIVEGGITRFDSVKNGLKKVDADSLVFVHDAVRCLLTPALIRRCGDEAERKGTAIPVIPVRDSIRRLDAGAKESVAVPREGLFIVQTPQVFLGSVLLQAFDVDYQIGFTDEASVMEASGYSVDLVEGEEFNIKITFPWDLSFADWKLSQLSKG